MRCLLKAESISSIINYCIIPYPIIGAIKTVRSKKKKSHLIDVSQPCMTLLYSRYSRAFCQVAISLVSRIITAFSPSSSNNAAAQSPSYIYCTRKGGPSQGWGSINNLAFCVGPCISSLFMPLPRIILCVTSMSNISDLQKLHSFTRFFK